MPPTPEPFQWLLVVWPFVLLFFMAIGGYFMFRKFLKLMPQADGKSILDRQIETVQRSRHLWTDETKAFLEQLVSPVPKPFRDAARHTIAAKIGEIALERGAERITIDHCIEGYILATPKRDHRYLVRFLEKNGIDYSRYRHLLPS